MEYVVHTPHGELRTPIQPWRGKDGVLVVQQEDGSETWLSAAGWFRVDVPAGGAPAVH